VEKAIYNEETILIPRKGTLTNLFYLSKPFWAVDTIFWSKINTSLCYGKYLFYLLKTHDLESLNVGSAVPSLTTEVLNDHTIQLPSIENQTAIASILTSLDDKIDLLHRQNKTLEALAETLFRQWFIEEAEDDWEETIFAEHTEVFRGLSYKGSGLAEVGNGIPMHNLNSVYEGGGYKYEGIKYYDGEYRDRHIIKPGDLIVTNTEQGHELKLIGCPAVVPLFFGEYGLFSQHIYKLSMLPKSYLTTQYFYYLMLTSRVREQITGATNGSTVNMLAIDGLQITKFILPPKSKIEQFTKLVKDNWQKKERNYEQIQILTQLRDNLLPKLMSGEVKVGL